MRINKILAVLLCICLCLTACGTVSSEKETTQAATQESTTQATITKETSTDAIQISLSDDGITVNGEPISADAASAVYAANDIVFYLEGQDFTYGEGEAKDAHSQQEADTHTVVHITQPGEYVLSGKLSAGQVAVDLGEEAESDPDAVVTLVLNGVDITCTVAPAVIFYNVYECGTADAETATMDVDTTAAGANVIIADGSENNIHGSYVARIYKSVELNEAGTEVVDSKKLHKYDAAFYAKKTMNIYGGQENSGVLNIYAENEGLDSELHLTVYGGNIHIESGNDGINTNEDNVSVTRIAGGTLDIVVNGSTGEGDGIDSNGWLVIDGGIVTASACGFSGDAGIDADMGVYIRGGQVAAAGNMFDPVNGEQTYVAFTFSQRQTGGNAYTLCNAQDQTVFHWAPVNDFQYLIISVPDLVAGSYTLWQGETQLQGSNGMMQMGGMPGMQGGQRPEMPEGMERPEGMEPPEGMERPEGMEPPEGMERPEGMEPPEGMERPEGMEPPEGMERPEGMEPPEGMENPGGIPGQRPGGFGGSGQGNFETQSPIFEIIEGGNMFFVFV